MRFARRDVAEPAIVKALRTIGAVVVRHDGKDEPDLFVLHAGRYFWIEVKNPEGKKGGVSGKGQKLSQGQNTFRAICRAARGEVHVVRSVDEAIKLVSGW